MRVPAIAFSCMTLLGLSGSCRQDPSQAQSGGPDGEARTEAQPQDGPDAGLEREVRAKLDGDSLLPGGAAIVVLVNAGRVVLEGQVASVNDRTLAEADAATVAGVVMVDNRLFVRSVGR